MSRLFIRLYILIAFTIISYNLVSEYVLDTVIAPTLEQDRINDMGGLLRSLDELVRLTPPDQNREYWEKLLVDINQSSNLPVELNKTEVYLENYPDVNSLILSGQDYLIDLETYELIHRISNSDLSFKLGPMALGEINFIDEVLANLLFVVLGFVLLIWTALFSYKLKRLKDATTSFGEGNFEVRAPENRSVAVGDLNHLFNQMAERITELLEEQKQLNRSISHELRSPISRIRCQIDLLEIAKTESKRREKVDGISEDLTELENLVSELLYYSRLEYMRVDNAQRTEIHSWLTTLVRTLQRETSIPIKLTCDNHIIYQINQTMLARALNNLIRNAIHNAKSQISLIVEVTQEYLIFSVDDDGLGVSLLDRERIFNPFERLDESRSRDTGGVGLGLAIVSRITGQLKGKVVVEDSQVLRGACFRLFIPKIQK